MCMHLYQQDICLYSEIMSNLDAYKD